MRYLLILEQDQTSLRAVEFAAAHGRDLAALPWSARKQADCCRFGLTPQTTDPSEIPARA